MSLLKELNSKLILAMFFVSWMFNATLSSAQSDDSGMETPPLLFGVKAGLNVNSFSSSQPHSSSTLGYTVGALGAYSFSDLIALQVEVSYFQQGGSLTQFKDNLRFGGTGVPDDFFNHSVTTSNITLHNLEIPLLAKITLPIGGDIRPKLLIGPSVGINLSANKKYATTGQSGVEPASVYMTTSGTERIGGYEQLQYGVNAGLGFEIPLGGATMLLIDARYRYGISTAKKSFSYIDYAPVSTDLKVNTLSITLGVGF